MQGFHCVQPAATLEVDIRHTQTEGFNLPLAGVTRTTRINTAVSQTVTYEVNKTATAAGTSQMQTCQTSNTSAHEALCCHTNMTLRCPPDRY